MTPQTTPSDRPSVRRTPVRRVNGNGKPRKATKKDAEETRQITPIGLLHAFRRRWIPAVAVGIPLALLAAVAVWELIPAPYESFGIVKVNQYKKVRVYDTGDIETNFLNFRDSQMAYLRSRVVLQASLRKPELSQTETMKVQKYPVDFLGDKLIVEAMESDEFVRIAMRGDNPRELATIVNGVKDAYMSEIVHAERTKKTKNLEELTTLLDERRTKWETEKKRSYDLGQSLGTGDSKIATLTIQLMNEELRDMYKTRREVQSDLREEEARRNARIRVGLPPDLPTPYLDPNQRSATQSQGAAFANNTLRIRQLRAQIGQMEDRLVPGRPNPQLDRYKQELEELKAELGTGPSATNISYSRYDSLTRELEDLNRDIKTTKANIDENGRKAIELESANEEVVRAERLFDELDTRVARLKVELDAPERVESVQDAHVPDVRDVKTRTRLAGIAAVGMFALVIAVFTLVEWLAQRISSPGELSSETGLRLLGSLPAPEKPGVLGKLGFGEANLNEWNRVLVESVDVVRTYLLRHLESQKSQAIVVASASANEGKTTLSTQLGSSVARSGRRVCVVDCDFRRPSAHLVFQTEQGTGIGELLRGEADVETVTRTTSIPGLFFISAGTIDDEALRILALDGGETLVSTLKKHFDFVIIDTSPVLFVAEPSMIAQHSDGVVMTVRRDYSRIGFVNQACNTLRNLEAPLVGAVMVGAESSIHRQTYGYQQDIRFAEPQAKRSKRQSV